MNWIEQKKKRKAKNLTNDWMLGGSHFLFFYFALSILMTYFCKCGKCVCVCGSVFFMHSVRYRTTWHSALFVCYLHSQIKIHERIMAAPGAIVSCSWSLFYWRLLTLKISLDCRNSIRDGGQNGMSAICLQFYLFR